MLTVAQVEAAGGYEVLYPDVPWPYKSRGRGSAANHYSTRLTMPQLAALPVARLAARDAVMFMWVTWPFLMERHQAHDLMEAWGFQPKTVAFVWVKKTVNGLDAVGGGSWTRANTEVCILGVRGRPRRHDSTEARSVRQLLLEEVDAGLLDEPETVEAEVGEHSAKPHVFRQRVEALMGPKKTRLEMFARERWTGWDAHGDEVPGGTDVELLLP